LNFCLKNRVQAVIYKKMIPEIKARIVNDPYPNSTRRMIIKMDEPGRICDICEANSTPSPFTRPPPRNIMSKMYTKIFCIPKRD
jgi:hypothetical protein